MERETIENILNFLKEKEGRKLPEAWVDLMKKLELVRELEAHPYGTQYRHEGYLDLYETNITKLPDDLYVDGILDLRSCQYLTELPDNLHVEGDLLLSGCKELRGLPDNLYFDGSLDIRGCAKITELPDYLDVNGTLALDGTNITELPDNLHVEVNLHIWRTPLAEKYTDEEIRNIITSKGGKIKHDIVR